MKGLRIDVNFVGAVGHIYTDRSQEVAFENASHIPQKKSHFFVQEAQRSSRRLSENEVRGVFLLTSK
jgi:hypothetical protein